MAMHILLSTNILLLWVITSLATSPCKSKNHFMTQHHTPTIKSIKNTMLLECCINAAKTTSAIISFNLLVF